MYSFVLKLEMQWGMHVRMCPHMRAFTGLGMVSLRTIHQQRRKARGQSQDPQPFVAHNRQTTWHIAGRHSMPHAQD